MANDDRDIAALGRDTKRRGIMIATIAGLALIGLGVVMVWLGVTFVEPAERIATRSVPKAAPIALDAVGVVIALAGLWTIIRGLRARS